MSFFIPPDIFVISSSPTTTTPTFVPPPGPPGPPGPTYDQGDWTYRLLSLFPRSWASDQAFAVGGLLYSVFNAIAGPFASLYAMLAYVKLQTRIKTATDINLDQISSDFFGGTLPRLPSETDDHFRIRILNALLGNATTRAGIAAALSNVGFTFKIVEDGNVNDIISLGRSGGLGTFGALGAQQQGKSAVYITIYNPLPAGESTFTAKALINQVKADGQRVWLAFV